MFYFSYEYVKERINSLLTKCRHLISSFEHSRALKRELKHQQTLLNYESKQKLQSEVRTRYSYVCNMTESICNNQTALQALQMNTATISEFVPTEEDFDTLNDLTDLLYHLREFITILGAQHYPTLSFCLPLIYGLLNGTVKCTILNSRIRVSAHLKTTLYLSYIGNLTFNAETFVLE